MSDVDDGRSRLSDSPGSAQLPCAPQRRLLVVPARPPSAPDEVVGRRMRRQGRRDTKPELAVRRGLHARGHRFRVDHAPEPDLRVRGDIVFTRWRLVVFIDGCFWHVCPLHCHFPTHNGAWWREKLEANVRRDAVNHGRLLDRGWEVRRFWEHERATDVVDAIDAWVRAARSVSP